MNDDDLIREVATKAFRDAMEARSQELAEDIARRMRDVLKPHAEQRERTKALRDGSLLIAGSRSQTETLETLLAASSAISSGCGLLILRGARAAGWNCQGLTTLENFKHAILDCSYGVAARVIESCGAAEVRASELDHIFVTRIDMDGSAKVALIPVLLKGHVSALLLALAPEGDEAAALEVLVQVAQLALDVQAYRKAPAPRPAVHEQTHTTGAEVQDHAAVHPAATAEVQGHAAVQPAEIPAAVEHPQVAETPAAEAEAPAPVEHEQAAEASFVQHEQVAETHISESEQATEAETPAIETEHVVESGAQEHDPVAAESAVPDAEEVHKPVASWQVEAAKALEAEPEAAADVPASQQTTPEPEHVETSVEASEAPEAVPVPEVSQPEPEVAYAARAVTPVDEPEIHVPEPEAAIPHHETAVPQRITYPVFYESASAPQPTPQVVDDSHQKARRFAKLLVEEIKLYNQSKVAEGRARGDLYFRLREDIEKSRAAYHKRYGESVRDVDYFSQELLRILADNNLSVMGAGFPG